MASSRNKASSSYPPPPLTSSYNYVKTKAEEILFTNDLNGITKLVTNLCYGKEPEDSSSSSNLLYDVFVEHLSDFLALRLIEVYRSGYVTVKVRSFSFELLDSLLLHLDNQNQCLGLKVLKEIKNHLDCLLRQEIEDHDFKLFSSIVSRISVDVFDNFKYWAQLCSYLIFRIEQQPQKVLLMFSNLPTILDGKFLNLLLYNNFYRKIVNLLQNQDSEDEDWCLALEAGFSMALQLLNLRRKELVWNMVNVILESVHEMVNVKRREMVVRKGIVRVAKIVRREAFRFRKSEYEIVLYLGLMLQRIDGVGEVTKMAAMGICEELPK